MWWSIFYLEHLLSVMTGRVTCLGDGSCSAPPPLPYNVTDRKYPSRNSSPERPTSTDDFQWTQRPDEIEKRPAWLKTMPHSESFYLFYLVDLALITHGITNQVYSADIVNKGWAHIEGRIRLYSKKLGQWLSELPSSLAFDGSQVDKSPSQTSLALHYYSACIVINRPCLTRPQADEENGIRFPRSRFGNDTALECLRASLALIDVVPDLLDINWAYSIAPSWTLLHFMMQATVILLLHLSIGSVPVRTGKAGKPDTSEGAACTLHYPMLCSLLQ